MKNQMSSFCARALPLAMAACLALALGGCASPSHTISPEAQANAARENPAPPRDEDFPALSSAKWSQGTFPSVEALRAMRTGMGKDQVRELLSWPHFSEGLGGVREWNYIFHFRTGKGPEYVTCQYMVRFNKEVLTNGMYWKGPNCTGLLAPPAAAVVPALVPSQPARHMSLGADGLFRFDGSGLNDILPQGRSKVEALAADIKRNFKALKSLQITAHTDRLGSDAYNQGLSMARARTIRELLVQQGIDRGAIGVAGMGEREPVVDCPGLRPTPALIGCLQPNRRFNIEISE
mgnify:CR=1 FL=1